MNKVNLPSGSYELLDERVRREMIDGAAREAIKVRIAGLTAEEAAALFVTDLTWSVTNDADTDHPMTDDRSHYKVPGDIISHRDGTVTVIMGEDLPEQRLSDALDTITGGGVRTVAEARVTRAKVESLFCAAADKLTGDEVIQCRQLAAEWQPGTYQAGDVRTDGGYPYKCVQAHDSTDNPAWRPSTERALWSPYHGTSPETALPFVQPTCAEDMYKAGEYMVWTDGEIMRAGQDTNYSPVDYPGAWESEVNSDENA